MLQNIINGGPDISQLPEVTITKTGASVAITITPATDGKRTGRRIMFTSIVLVIDCQSSAFRLLRLNERGGGYTDYEFTNYTFEEE